METVVGYSSSKEAGATHLIRKVMLRMEAWMNYVRP